MGLELQGVGFWEAGGFQSRHSVGFAGLGFLGFRGL